MRARKGTAVSPPRRVKDSLSIRRSSLACKRCRHVADLVEEQRAAPGAFGIAEMALVGAGEGTLLVTEEFAFQEIGWDRRAVHRDERLLRARRDLMQEPRRDLLAGSGLARDQHRQVMRGVAMDEVLGVLDRRRLAQARIPSAACRRACCAGRWRSASGSRPWRRAWS